MFQFETAGPQHVAPGALPPSPLHFPPQSSCDEEGGYCAPHGVMNLEGQWVQGLTWVASESRPINQPTKAQLR